MTLNWNNCSTGNLADVRTLTIKDSKKRPTEPLSIITFPAYEGRYGVTTNHRNETLVRIGRLEAQVVETYVAGKLVQA